MESLEKIVKEYVGEAYQGDTDFIPKAENFLSWLTKKYALIKMEDLQEVYKYPQRHTENIPGTLSSQVIGIKKVLEDLFPEVTSKNNHRL